MRRSIGVWLTLLAMGSSILATANPTCMLVHPLTETLVSDQADPAELAMAGMAMPHTSQAGEHETSASQLPCCPPRPLHGPSQSPVSACPLTLVTLPMTGATIVEIVSLGTNDHPSAAGIGPKDWSIAPEPPPPRA